MFDFSSCIRLFFLFYLCTMFSQFCLYVMTVIFVSLSFGFNEIVRQWNRGQNILKKSTKLWNDPVLFSFFFLFPYLFNMKFWIRNYLLLGHPSYHQMSACFRSTFWVLTLARLSGASSRLYHACVEIIALNLLGPCPSPSCWTHSNLNVYRLDSIQGGS